MDVIGIYSICSFYYIQYIWNYLRTMHNVWEKTSLLPNIDCPNFILLGFLCRRRGCLDITECDIIRPNKIWLLALCGCGLRLLPFALSLQHLLQLAKKDQSFHSPHELIHPPIIIIQKNIYCWCLYRYIYVINTID